MGWWFLPNIRNGLVELLHFVVFMDVIVVGVIVSGMVVGGGVGVGCSCASKSLKFQINMFIFCEVRYDLGVNSQLP